MINTAVGKTRYALGRVTPSEPGCPHAFAVKLTPELGKLVTSCWWLWVGTCRRNPKIFQMSFWDTNCRWLADWPKGLREPGEADCDMVTLSARQAERHVESYTHWVSVTGERLVVGDNIVEWTCYPEDRFYMVESGALPLSYFLLPFAEAVLPEDPTVRAFRAFAREEEDFCDFEDYAEFADYLQEKGVLT